MEKSEQNRHVYMMENPWIDTRLTEEEMDFLWQIISEENKEDYSKQLAGNISKSELIVDKDNWFFKSALKKLTERIFYRNWNNYCRYQLEKEEPSKFELENFWVNYQKQHEFNPLPHLHSGLFSFVVFVRIPTHWKEQHALPISANSRNPCASDFEFLLGHGKHVDTISIPLSPEDEGRMLFFPAWLKHQVYPFYGTEEYRMSISGNIDFLREKVEEGEEAPKGKVIKKEVEKQMMFYEEQLKFLREQLKKTKD